MQYFKKIILTAVVTTLTSFALADVLPDEVGVITTFTSGTPALAEEINGNFQEIIRRLEALENSLNNNISGRSYKMSAHTQWFHSSKVGSSESFINIFNDSYVSQGIFRTLQEYINFDLYINDDGTFSLAGNGSEIAIVTGYNSFIGRNSKNPSRSGTWVQTNNDLSLTFTGSNETFNFTVSKHGDAILGSSVKLQETSLRYVREYDGASIYSQSYETWFWSGIEVDSPIDSPVE